MTTPTHLTEAQLAEFQTKLEMQKAQVEKDLLRVRDQELPNLYRGEESGDGYGDDAKTDQIRQRLVQQVKQLEEKELAITAALGRIDRGTFGIDERSGQPIRIARLEAMPTARFDIG